ncbi:MAG TPA: hypothetical protein VH418_21515, partial [Solirubrobacteraceae bacterium]
MAKPTASSHSNSGRSGGGDAVPALAIGPGALRRPGRDHRVRAPRGGLEGRRVVEVRAHDLGAEPRHRGAHRGQHPVPALDEQPRDGTSDAAGCAEHQYLHGVSKVPPG